MADQPCGAATLPDAIIIGASKCASTSLTALLDRHPDTFVVPHEVGFFADDEKWARGIDWYSALFAASPAGALRVENSNIYTMLEVYPETVPRLRQTFSVPADLRVVYIVRDPIARAESFWIELRSHNSEVVHHDFNTAVRRDRAWLVDPSRYWHQLQPYRRLVGDDNILVVFTEDLRADQAGVERACLEFLELRPVEGSTSRVQENPSAEKRIPRPTLSRLRAVPGYDEVSSRIPVGLRAKLRDRLLFRPVRGRPEWSAETRQWLLQEVADDSAALLEYTGKPADFWPTA